jgi:hypothetical protein
MAATWRWRCATRRVPQTIVIRKTQMAGFLMRSPYPGVDPYIMEGMIGRRALGTEYRRRVIQVIFQEMKISLSYLPPQPHNGMSFRKDVRHEMVRDCKRLESLHR